MTEHIFLATAAKHLEPLVADELMGLGLRDIAQTRSAVRFSGTLADGYRACLWSRTANRVLLVLARFPAASPEALYAGVREIPWHEHLAADGSLAVDLVAAASTITHSHYGALKVKDAVVDQFRERFHIRPSVDTERPHVRINVYLRRDEATLALDLSGDSLHRRGYRVRGVAAPLKENLAAAILLRAQWPELAAGGAPLVDPMCGSGTLPIEAALMAADVAPGLRRDYWGFAGWRGHDRSAWERLVEEAQARREAGLGRLPPIRGYDRDPRAVESARANAARAGLEGMIELAQGELARCGPRAGEPPGLVVVNPPYGERLGTDSTLPALYAQLGSVLRERYAGWRAAVFTGNPELGKRLGIRARRVHTLLNGPIPCKLLHLEVGPEWFVSGTPRPLPVDERSDGARALANRLEKNRRHLARWLKREGISCYRLYDADLPEYALAVDVYEGDRRRVHVQEYEAPASVDASKARLRLREALGVIAEVLAVPEDALYLKRRRRQRGTAQYERLGETGRLHEVRERGCRFLVNLEDYLDTGLFLDHRPTRALIGRLAGGHRFLNLFAYTGTATVCAAHGGASATTTVDMSRTYLDWARRNMSLNGFHGGVHEYVQADVLRWLDGASGHYGVIFLDPPSFSTSKRMQGTLDVQRDHVELIQSTVERLEPDGLLIFSTNLRRFRMDTEALTALSIEDISRATLDRDFERSPRIHMCWKIQRQGTVMVKNGRPVRRKLSNP